MSAGEEQMIACFRKFVEAGLVTHEPAVALSLVAEDVIGIGMGAQGVVSCKADAARIIGDSRKESDKSIAALEYVSVQARCYEERYGTVCGVLKIKTTDKTKVVVSTLGQIINFRKENDSWLIYALQATPIFEQIEELEAYPIKFAENVLETYRQQEQIAKNAQNDSMAVYMVNFTTNMFENAVLKSDLVISTNKGDPYEQTLFNAARQRLCPEAHYNFISMFSLGNVRNAYEQGQTELSMEYEMIVSPQKSVWTKTLIKLYTDKADENLKGYLYVIDIDKDKRRELELQSKAELDPLTKLYNKNYAELKITEKLEALSPTSQGAFFMIDLDCFKNINDTYGHQEGDRVIQATACHISSLTRKTDIAGRLGGDEFCIYFQGHFTSELVAHWADTLCQNIRQIIPLAQNGTSCSIGIVFCSNPKISFQDIYRRADEALYQQKRNGRNGYTIYAEEQDL